MNLDVCRFREKLRPPRLFLSTRRKLDRLFRVKSLMDHTQTHTAHEFEHDSPLIGCRFDPSGRYVFAGAQDFKVWRFSVADGAKIPLDVGAWTRAIAFVDEGKTVVTGGYDGKLVFAPVEGEGEQLLASRTIENAHDGWIRALAVSPDGTTLASVGNDQIVRLWNVESGELIQEMPGHESHIYNVAFHPSGTRLVTGDLKANIRDWEIRTGRQLRGWQAESLTKFDKTFVAFIGGFRGMCFSKDGKKLACSGITAVTNAFAGVGNPSVMVYDWEKGEALAEQLSKGKLRGVAWGVALHPEDLTIACVGGNGGHLLFWKPEELEDSHRLKLTNDARDLDLSSDGISLATAHFDGKLRIHRMEKKPEEEVIDSGLSGVESD
ncbi:MAG: WD40 repeat protein [Verrucomicrobiales bacterium]|jgi:WD40 repeat protein